MNPPERELGTDRSAEAREAVRTLAQRLSRRTVVSDDEMSSLNAAVRALGPPATRYTSLVGQARSHDNTHPMFPDMSYEVDLDGFRGTVVFPPVFEGLGAAAHGGFIAVALDNALGSAALIHAASRTASITVNYRSRVPIGRELHVAAQVDQIEGRKIWVSGSIKDDERTCAEATGLWITVSAF